MLRTVFILSLCFAAAANAADVELSENDQVAIHEAALNYAHGWYAGDRERMERSLHPELAKRAYLPDKDGKRSLSQMGKDVLLAGNRPQNKAQYENTAKRADIEILDGFDDVATVKLVMNDWVDYMHLVRTPDDQWQIINVLWELTPPNEPAR